MWVNSLVNLTEHKASPSGKDGFMGLPQYMEKLVHLWVVNILHWYSFSTISGKKVDLWRGNRHCFSSDHPNNNRWNNTCSGCSTTPEYRSTREWTGFLIEIWGPSMVPMVPIFFGQVFHLGQVGLGTWHNVPQWVMPKWSTRSMIMGRARVNATMVKKLLLLTYQKKQSIAAS